MKSIILVLISVFCATTSVGRPGIKCNMKFESKGASSKVYLPFLPTIVVLVCTIRSLNFSPLLDTCEFLKTQNLSKQFLKLIFSPFVLVNIGDQPIGTKGTSAPP